MAESYSNEVAGRLLTRAVERQEIYRVDELRLLEMAREAGVHPATLEEIKREWRLEVQQYHRNCIALKKATRPMLRLTGAYVIGSCFAYFVALSGDHTIGIYLFVWFLSSLWVGSKVVRFWLLERLVKKGRATYPALTPADESRLLNGDFPALSYPMQWSEPEQLR